MHKLLDILVKNFGLINKSQPVTRYIKHLADSANFKGITLNRLCSGLTD